MKLTDISPAIALTPLDGRYHNATAPLVEYLSEPALNRERMRVEVEWMILLANGFEERKIMRNLSRGVSEPHCRNIACVKKC